MTMHRRSRPSRRPTAESSSRGREGWHKTMLHLQLRKGQERVDVPRIARSHEVDAREWLGSVDHREPTWAVARNFKLLSCGIDAEACWKAATTTNSRERGNMI